MRRIASVVTCVAAAVLLVLPALAQSGGAGSPGPVDIERPPARDLGRTNPPRPDPPIATTFTSDNMQLVGFTERPLVGNAGVLNMSIACQEEFRGSRMCTMEEINRSVFIPEAPGSGFAWVQVLTQPSGAEVNCNGWMSDDPLHRGASIELGDCYGGLETQPCNSSLSVACCANEGLMVLR